MTAKDAPPPAREGLRERKRRETSQRIVDTGIALFILIGIDATTLDEIAAAAGISRRTFFHYFESKDDILLSLQSGMGDMIVAALRDEPDSERPLIAVRNAVIKICAAVPPDEMIALDRLMRSSPGVQARKQASYIRHEHALYAALREKWPAPEQDSSLRLLAMAAIGAIRLSTDAFNRDDGARPLAAHLGEAFDALDAGF